MSVDSFVRQHVRPFIPFPKRRTWLRYFPTFETRNIVHIFRQTEINTVLDIGANRGQFAERIRSGGYKGKIVSFEPNLDAYGLLQRASMSDPYWIVAEPFALGDARGLATLSIPSDSSLGSLLSLVNPQHVKYQPIPVKRLDDVMPGLNIPASANVAIKIDVQGLEDKVLDGAEETLDRCKAVFIEVSLKTMYIGEPSYLDILNRLKVRGFDAVFFSPVINRKKYGESWQTDVLLVRRR